MWRVEAAVGLDGPHARLGRQHLFDRALEGGGKPLVVPGADRQPGGLRVAAEAQNQPGRALGDEVEAVAQMQPGNRAPGPLEHCARAFRRCFRSLGEADDGTVEAVLQARGEDAYHALMPIRVEEARPRIFIRDVSYEEQGLLEHRRFDLAALAVEAVELLGDVHGARLVLGDQAFDAYAHVPQAPRRLDPP